MSDDDQGTARIVQISRDLHEAHESTRPLRRIPLLNDLRWVLLQARAWKQRYDGMKTERSHYVEQVKSRNDRIIELEAERAAKPVAEPAAPPVTGPTIDRTTPRLWIGLKTKTTPHWTWSDVDCEWTHHDSWGVLQGNIFVQGGGPTPPRLVEGKHIVTCQTEFWNDEVAEPTKDDETDEVTGCREPRVWTGPSIVTPHWFWGASVWKHYANALLSSSNIFIGGDGPKPTVTPERSELQECHERDW